MIAFLSPTLWAMLFFFAFLSGFCLATAMARWAIHYQPKRMEDLPTGQAGFIPPIWAGMTKDDAAAMQKYLDRTIEDDVRQRP